MQRGQRLVNGIGNWKKLTVGTIVTEVCSMTRAASLLKWKCD